MLALSEASELDFMLYGRHMCLILFDVRYITWFFITWLIQWTVRVEAGTPRMPCHAHRVESRPSYPKSQIKPHIKANITRMEHNLRTYSTVGRTLALHLHSH